MKNKKQRNLAKIPIFRRFVFNLARHEGKDVDGDVLHISRKLLWFKYYVELYVNESANQIFAYNQSLVK